MGLSTAERNILSRAIVFGGRSAVGKQIVAEETAGLLGGRALITGRAVRALADIAVRWQQVDDADGDSPRLRIGAADLLRGALIPGLVSVRFTSVPGDRSLHVLFSQDDLTERINPQFRRRHGLINLEPTAALLATTPSIRPSFLNLWRRTITKPDNHVTIIVAKKPEALVPESPLVVWLTADPETSARYRFRTGANVRASVADELAYLQGRDGHHRQNGLDDVPDGAFTLDMNPLLLEPDGPKRAAALVFQEYRRRLGW